VEYPKLFGAAQGFQGVALEGVPSVKCDFELAVGGESA
jgi:hypothetical protein